MRPIFVEGRVVKGFGRGSKELGIPTANFETAVVKSAVASNDLDNGIYMGWAKLNNDGLVHKMVVSVGWNPYYKNVEKSVETHIMREFESDFYDAWLRIAIVDYIRPEKNFDSLADLIAAIKGDIAQADAQLKRPELEALKTSEFFTKKLTL